MYFGFEGNWFVWYFGNGWISKEVDENLDMILYL